MAGAEYDLEFLDSEIETLLTEGLDSVSDDVIVLDEESETVACMFSFTATENVDNPYEKFGDLLEEEGYERGERLGGVSYGAELDPEGVETAIQQPYVEAAELDRAVNIDVWPRNEQE